MFLFHRNLSLLQSSKGLRVVLTVALAQSRLHLGLDQLQGSQLGSRESPHCPMLVDRLLQTLPSPTMTKVG